MPLSARVGISSGGVLDLGVEVMVKESGWPKDMQVHLDQYRGGALQQRNYRIDYRLVAPPIEKSGRGLSGLPIMRLRRDAGRYVDLELPFITDQPQI